MRSFALATMRPTFITLNSMNRSKIINCTSSAYGAICRPPATNTDPTPEARHHTVGAITLIPLLLNLLVARQINVFRQRRPFAHLHVHLLRLPIARQHLQPADVGAIHDLWPMVLLRRDSRGERRSWLGGSARRLTRPPCVGMV